MEEKMLWLQENIKDEDWYGRFQLLVMGNGSKPRAGFEEQMLRRISKDGFACPLDLQMVNFNYVLRHFFGHANLRTLKSKPLQILPDLDEIEARKYRHCFIPGCKGHFWRFENDASFREQMRVHLCFHDNEDLEPYGFNRDLLWGDIEQAKSKKVHQCWELSHAVNVAAHENFLANLDESHREVS